MGGGVGGGVGVVSGGVGVGRGGRWSVEDVAEGFVIEKSLQQGEEEEQAVSAKEKSSRCNGAYGLGGSQAAAAAFESKQRQQPSCE
jgi:hypothetical protein